MSIIAIVPAAGVGRRFGGETPKQYLTLHGTTVMEHTLALLLSQPQIGRVIVALHPDDTRWQTLPVFADARIERVAGGDERCHSVRNALAHGLERQPTAQWALVHDVARPCCPRGDIDKLIRQLGHHPVGGLLAAPVSDTLKRVDAMQQVQETVDRASLWAALTPQLFRARLLLDALDVCLARGVLVTDEAQALEAIGLSPQVVEGSRRNLKITRPEDLALAEYFLSLDRPQHRL
jgi:2-C-methyl-D-erythritol 4-phosphate cytidylyltransferase